MTVRAIGYVRVSTDEQAASGLGLEAQRAALAAAGARLRLELAEVHADEGLSGALAPAERPGLLAALAALRAGDVLLVAKRDRLGRDRLEVGLLERALVKRGSRVISAAGEGTESDDPSAQLQRAMVDVFAEHERLMIGARTKAALAAKRSRGEPLGRAPFGWRHEDGALVEVREEQVALALMRERRALGASFRAIARTLTAHGFAPRGSRWHPGSVQAILKGMTDAVLSSVLVQGRADRPYFVGEVIPVYLTPAKDFTVLPQRKPVAVVAHVRRWLSRDRADLTIKGSALYQGDA